jgi:hypothetical protein
MKHHVLHPHSPFRIFAFSATATVAAIVWSGVERGLDIVVLTAILIAVEVAFSFDNAIVNAKILARMSRFWQNMFLTVGAAIAIFGMRIIFPIVIVSITAGLGFKEVLDLATNHPDEYAHELEKAHAPLSAFGGAFLMMLAMHFFVDPTREVRWYERLERPLQKLAATWAPAAITTTALLVVWALPFNHHKKETLVAGAIGIAIYSAIHFLTSHFEKIQRRNMGKKIEVQVGMAAFVSFMYLEILDASFSFDSVLGAFAVTKDIVLIAIGLGVGALWVRSLTIFMVRRGTLNNYRYIDHGAHYTITVLATILLLSIFVRVPEVITGLTGVGIIGASILASKQALDNSKKPARAK